MSENDTLARRFHEGLCLQADGDHSGAASVFLECTLADPASAPMVEEFLAAARRKYSLDQPTATSADGIDALLLRAASDNNWTEVLCQGPRLLMSHPWHAPALAALADA